MILLLSATFTESMRFVPVAKAVSSTVAVFVGFADDINESTSDLFVNPTYPIPWCGSPMVTVIGDCSYVEAGVVMLVNKGSMDATVDNVTAILPANSTGIIYNDMSSGGSLTISPGHAVILSENSETSFYQDYDTSDYTALPPCSSPVVGGMLAPRVVLGIGGRNTTYIDVNHVLDTGGSDLGACGGADETTQWQQVFTSANSAAAKQQLQAIGGSYASKIESGTNWNFTNSGVCGRPGTPAQCEAASVGLLGTSSLHMVDSLGNPLPFSGTAVSSGIALGGCQSAFKQLPLVKYGDGTIGSCFDLALISDYRVVGNVNLTVKIKLPISVAGPTCKLVKVQIAHLANKLPGLDGGPVSPSAFKVKGDQVICAITVVQDTSVIATSALNAAGHTPMTTILETNMSILCHSPSSVGRLSMCKTTVKSVVSGNHASGIVSWSNGGLPGTFLHNTCTLSAQGSCTVKYRPTSLPPSPAALTASYAGDAPHGFAPSGNIYQLSVSARVSKVIISCTPSSQHLGSPAPFVCKATVRGGYLLGGPSESVIWSGSGLVGVSCSLAANPCQVNIFPTGWGLGVHQVTATYAGDTNNLGSSKVKNLMIN
jgi:hypothetical protein